MDFSQQLKVLDGKWHALINLVIYYIKNIFNNYLKIILI
jgi:hypothetical protein